MPSAEIVPLRDDTKPKQKKKRNSVPIKVSQNGDYHKVCPKKKKETLYL